MAAAANLFSLRTLTLCSSSVPVVIPCIEEGCTGPAVLLLESHLVLGVGAGVVVDSSLTLVVVGHDGTVVS